jgi:hypothetical protein
MCRPRLTLGRACRGRTRWAWSARCGTGRSAVTRPRCDRSLRFVPAPCRSSRAILQWTAAIPNCRPGRDAGEPRTVDCPVGELPAVVQVRRWHLGGPAHREARDSQPLLTDHTSRLSADTPPPDCRSAASAAGHLPRRERPDHQDLRRLTLDSARVWVVHLRVEPADRWQGRYCYLIIRTHPMIGVCAATQGRSSANAVPALRAIADGEELSERRRSSGSCHTTAAHARSDRRRSRTWRLDGYLDGHA